MKPLKAPPTAIDIGDLDRNYAVIRELGRGGMGSVYLARHREAGHRVAIKIASTEKFDAEAVARFAREARLMARFRHPNIVRLYDVRQIGVGRVGIVMEYVRGVSLSRLVTERKRLPFETCTSILRDLGNALAHAHEHGVVHRDVKPPNVLVDEETGTAKLSDFGIAKVNSDEADVTAVGAVVGTPAYMSPEQIDGREIDGRSDIYGLGVLGWEIVTGEHPWAGEALYKLLFKQKHEALPLVTTFRPDTPPSLVLALEGALEKDPAHRWSSVGDMVTQLASNEPTDALLERRKRRAAAVHARAAQPVADAQTIPVPRRPRRPAAPSPASAPNGETLPNVEAALRQPGDTPVAPVGVVAPPRWRSALSIGLGVVAGGIVMLFVSRSLGLLSPGESRAAPPVLATRAESSSLTPVPTTAPSGHRTTTDSKPVRVVEASERHGANASEVRAGNTPSRTPPVPTVAIVAPVKASLERQPVAPDTTLERRAEAFALVNRARVLAYAGYADRATRIVDSALAVDALSGAGYGVRARLKIRDGAVRDAWTDIELASRTGAKWEALALTTMLKARELGAAEARARLTPELRAALIPRRALEAERAVALAVALAQVGDTATALTLLERANSGDSRMASLLTDPLLAPLHASGRFAELVKRATGNR